MPGRFVYLFYLWWSALGGRSALDGEALVLGGAEAAGAEGYTLGAAVDHDLRLLYVGKEPAVGVAVRVADVLTSPTSLTANGAHCHGVAYYLLFRVADLVGPTYNARVAREISLAWPS
jgi:hypothetical protein